MAFIKRPFFPETDKKEKNSPKSIYIEYDSRYIFTFLENKEDISPHPVDNYYLQLHDLSINLLISLKWIKWAIFFFKSLAEALDKLGDNYTIENILTTPIQNIKTLKNEERERIFIIDDNIIQSDEDIKLLFSKLYENSFLNPEINPLFHPNTKVHLKLKLNLREYLIVSNLLFPCFMKITSVYTNE